MRDYKELCLSKISSMDSDTYNKYCRVIIAAQKGEISWETLWNHHLKDMARVSLRG